MGCTTAHRVNWVFLFSLSRLLPDPWVCNLHSQNSLFTVWLQLAVLCQLEKSALLKLDPDSEVRGKSAVVSPAQQTAAGSGFGMTAHPHGAELLRGAGPHPCPRVSPWGMATKLSLQL